MSGVWKSQEEAKLLGIFEESLAPQGYKVVDLDVRLASRSLVRLYIDRQQGAGKVSVDDCAQVTRLVSPVVDEAIHGKYDLEVSSPGLDRRLRLDKDFEQVVGEMVTLKMQAEVEGLGKTVHGTVQGVSEEGIRILVEGRGEFKILFQQIRQANLKR